MQIAVVLATEQMESEKGEIEVVQYALFAEIYSTSGTTTTMIVLLN